MNIFRERSIRDFITIHLIFAAITVLTLLFPFPQAPVSGKLLLLVIIYNALIILEFYGKDYEDWRSIWTFSIILSLMMIFPDWFLAATLHALQFPDDGLPMIGGEIPFYMAGLWTIPFFIIIFIGKEIQQRKSAKQTYTTVSVISALIFILAELTMVFLPSWSATVIGMTGNLAWYIIIPEVFLGLSAFVIYDMSRNKKNWIRIVGAYVVMVLYIGNTSFFYFIVETLLLGA